LVGILERNRSRNLRGTNIISGDTDNSGIEVKEKTELGSWD
jgi:hypothetical protein